MWTCLPSAGLLRRNVYSAPHAIFSWVVVIIFDIELYVENEALSDTRLANISSYSLGCFPPLLAVSLLCGASQLAVAPPGPTCLAWLCRLRFRHHIHERTVESDVQSLPRCSHLGVPVSGLTLKPLVHLVLKVNVFNQFSSLGTMLMERHSLYFT